MTLIVLAVLATAWLGYFVLWFRRGERHSRGGPTEWPASTHPPTTRAACPRCRWASAWRRNPEASSFEAPRSAQQAHSRRRQVATLLGLVAVGSLLAVPALGASALAVHVLADMALLLFAFGAVRRQQPAAPGIAEVRLLYPPTMEPGDAAATPLRRVVNG